MGTALARLTQRLDHAWDLRERFYSESHEFLSGRPYRMWDERNDDGWTSVFVEPTSSVPPRLGFLAGDCLHNLRAVLDNLVTALPSADPERSAFVILDVDPAPVAFAKEARRALRGIDPAAVAVVESLQPYNRWPLATSPEVPIGGLLHLLHRLWNHDKHRSPTVAMHGVTQRQIVINGVPLDPPAVNTPPRAFGGRQEVVRIKLAWGQPPVDLKALVAVDLVLGDGPAAGLLADTVLFDLHNCVRFDVLPRLAAYL